MDAEQRVSLLERGMALASEISPHYDDVLREASSRIGASGSVGKGDIAMLAFWKRIPTGSWDVRLLSTSEERVREVTAPAVAALTTDAKVPDLIAAAQRARELLRDLPGLGTGSPMASAVLTAIRPGDLAVYDANANEGLKLVGLDLALNADPHYSEFLRRIEQCRKEARAIRGHRWSAHEVDLALYKLGKNSRGSSGS
jgi:hypothetical protein